MDLTKDPNIHLRLTDTSVISPQNSNDMCEHCLI